MKTKKLNTDCVIHVYYSAVFQRTKFSYEYQFVSRGREVCFRGLSVYALVKMSSYPRKEWVSAVFSYPGSTHKGLSIDLSKLPPDIASIKSRKDILIPKEVMAAAQKKTSLKVVRTLAKT